MGGCKCAFYHCNNNTLKAKESNSIHSHFFHWPVKDYGNLSVIFYHKNNDNL